MIKIMKNTIIIILTLLFVASNLTINSIKREPNRYKDYLQGIVKVIDTKQTKINCKNNEDPYFFTDNTVGSTSPKLDSFQKNLIEIGVVCVDRITQEDKAINAIVFENPLLIDKGYSILGLSNELYVK